ncbi:MAG: CRP-like cAMP-binding protein [Paracrocinitomix sp.]|jgi:CRP-like cAMP-binding protein|tara:strand:+ start:124 stop:540 length:417 start_codon:yes stop_codon:yes gene_type:complete
MKTSQRACLDAVHHVDAGLAGHLSGQRCCWCEHRHAGTGERSFKENSLENIGQTPLFASCPQPERDLLTTMRVPMTVVSGNGGVRQGDFGATIGVILEGRASVWSDGSHVADLQAGDCFGELALFAPPSDGGHRTASI